MTNEQAARLYKESGSTKVVMRHAGCDFYTAKRLIVDGGGTLLGRRRKSRLEKKKIVSLYSTHSVSQIAKMNGTSNSVILRVLEEAKVPRRPRGGGRRKIIHGLASEAAKIGLGTNRYLRLLAVRNLGNCCCRCGQTDIRVLDLNHIEGKGKQNEKGKRSRCWVYKDLLKLATGGKVAYAEVLCANCNRLHEYERGTIPPIPACCLE